MWKNKKLKISGRLIVTLISALCFMGCTPTTECREEVSSFISNEEEVAELQDSVEEVVAQEIEEEPEVHEIEETDIPEDSTFSIRFIDVGQADAALVECDGHYMLIDGGNSSDSDKMYTILKQSHITKLDIVVGTHPDADHIGGLAGALNYATADTVLCPVTSHDTRAFENFKKYAEKNGNGIEVPSIGDSYELGSSTATILGVNGGNESNESSILLKIQYGETSFLFTGDAGREAEQAVLNTGADLSATVLKVGHHGSADSTTYPFLREIMPAYAVISAGKGNSYNHPTDAALSRLRDADVKVYRTDLQGDITVTSDGTTVSFSTAKEATEEEIMTSAEEAARIEKAEADRKAQAETKQKQQENDNTDNSVQASPVGMDYVLNTNTKKFHYPSCRSVKQMKAKNTTYFTGTRDEVIEKGYEPCGNCHP